MGFSYEKDYFEALKKVKEYLPQREWMVAEGLNLSDFEIEDEFQELNKKFKLEAKGRQVRLTKALIIAAEKKTRANESERKRIMLNMK